MRRYILRDRVRCVTDALTEVEVTLRYIRVHQSISSHCYVRRVVYQCKRCTAAFNNTVADVFSHQSRFRSDAAPTVAFSHSEHPQPMTYPGFRFGGINLSKF